jgi:hypothetical protein
MRRSIKTADDLAWLLQHTNAFQGGQVTDLHIHKRRLFDEASAREIVSGTVVTAHIQYELAVHGYGRFYAVTRYAKLTMTGATDFSVFEQDGADCSVIGVMHAELSDGHLRFWFDPRGELYVICDEAELEEVSRPGEHRPLRRGMREWTFQAEAGEDPAVAWLLDRLDGAGIPCVWRASKPSSHPSVRWEGHLTPVGRDGSMQAAGISVQAYGPLEGCGSGFGITLRTTDPHDDATERLLMALADLIARNFTGTCLAGTHLIERDEWLGDHRDGRRPALQKPA